jgi:hypothetical protein
MYLRIKRLTIKHENYTNGIEYLYTREIENSSLVKELLSLLLNNGERGTIKPTIFEDLIQIIDNVCAIYSKSIIVLVNETKMCLKNNNLNIYFLYYNWAKK